MSSITYPLTALNFAEENISAEMLDSMLKTIIAGQQSDGGFPYCTVDMGYGISSEDVYKRQIYSFQLFPPPAFYRNYWFLLCANAFRLNIYLSYIHLLKN